jgi:HEPN domain-containing protein
MPHRHEDWLAQARRDLQAARHSLTTQDYDWCAYQSQQSAEKAIKALLRLHSNEKRGHDLLKLLKELKPILQVPGTVIDASRRLDKQHFMSRYPDSITEGFPAEFYNEKIASECLADAETVLTFVEKNIS